MLLLEIEMPRTRRHHRNESSGVKLPKIPIRETYLYGLIDRKDFEELGTIIGFARERISLGDRVVQAFKKTRSGSDDRVKLRMDTAIEKAEEDMIRKAIKKFPNTVSIYNATYRVQTSLSMFAHYVECEIKGIAVSKKEEPAAAPAAAENKKESTAAAAAAAENKKESTAAAENKKESVASNNKKTRKHSNRRH